MIDMGEAVIQENDGWYVLDETWNYHSGPYETKEEALVALQRYVEYLG